MTVRAAHGLIVLVGVCAGAGAARADAIAPAGARTEVAGAAPAAPDPSAIEAGDANLEPLGDRRGVTFAACFGGGLMVGFGIKDSVGRGGAGSLRLGHVATPRTVVTFEIEGTGALHRPAKTAAIETNTLINALVGAQYYANRSLWLRSAGGFGLYQGRKVVMSNGTLGDVTLPGGTMLFGAGFDLARYKWLVATFEVRLSAMINSDGVLMAFGTGFGIAFD